MNTPNEDQTHAEPQQPATGRAVTNTAAIGSPLPAPVLATLFPGSIERMEAAGQTELVTSDVLPAEWHPKNAALVLLGWGVKLGAPVEGDPLFVYATLPPGWRKVATEHSMHSKLMDERGRERAGIFYKAAFYDRRATGSLRCRFSVGKRYDDEPGVIFDVEDSGVLVFSSSRLPDADEYYESKAVREKCRSECVEFLKDYPDFENPAAYWDEPLAQGAP